ncbi:adenosine receptor A1-like [Acipenser oxyrinchus oxyrinchus]|uniref:Adenosine receptor A1-like n=1 Tax=Acipenser oxyrinchus oxyrinchus TaxID=40147 RepID=A0AAD8CMY9_ACIOX|nr:adenosine receptor A1-like [Acipenser oxyrinchus oxyrinchus]
MTHEDYIAYIFIEVGIALMSCLGNLLVIATILVNNLLREPIFIFIISLALADFAVGLFVIPICIISSFEPEIHFYICLFISCIILIITQSSILSLLAIAFDRYLRVKIPMKYKIIVNQRHAVIIAIVCWLISTVLGIIPMLGWNNKTSPGNETTTMNSTCIKCTFLSVMSISYMVYLNFFGWVLAPLLLMIYLYGTIFYKIRKHQNRNIVNSTQSVRCYQKEHKLTKSLSLILFLFVVCWLPLHIINCILFFSPHTEVPEIAIYIGIILTHGNSVVNPIVYAFKIKKFRKTYVQLWNKCFH